MITYIGGGAPLELYSGPSGTEVSSVLQDNGNLVLKQGITERILWQTFDFPMDCFLPGMKLGINHMTGQNLSHTPWLTDSIPASGAFSLASWSKLWIWILIAVAATLIVILSGILVFLRPRILRLQGAPEFIKVEM
ncbi:hypothetical protein LWI28_006746 [Acer negundo]|uniref:Bulb-type lectin domain-containing protein n=1 Tax=Acer negundo TaxID=4023 RepID=A0AAD5NWP0_ACENE|nr:hypothetical protein LWI28_006746 [Acer negundo]